MSVGSETMNFADDSHERDECSETFMDFIGKSPATCLNDKLLVKSTKEHIICRQSFLLSSLDLVSKNETAVFNLGTATVCELSKAASMELKGKLAEKIESPTGVKVFHINRTRISTLEKNRPIADCLVIRKKS